MGVGEALEFSQYLRLYDCILYDTYCTIVGDNCIGVAAAKVEWGKVWSLTFGAERSVVGRGGAVARVAVVLLHTLASVAAVHPEAGAVARASGLHSRCDLRPLLEVKGHAVHSQRTDASQEPSLTAGGTCCEPSESGHHLHSHHRHN